MQSDDSRSNETRKVVSSWDELRQMLEDAGVPLSPEQEARYQQANEQLRAIAEPEFRAAPITLILKFLVMPISPEWFLDIVGGSQLRDTILNYLTVMSQLLTPEQREVWERNRDR